MLQWTIIDPKTGNAIGDRMSKYAPHISGYANASRGEYIAESYAAYMKGQKGILDPEFVKLFEDKKTVAKIHRNSKIISGARIVDPNGKEATAFAKMYYREIRSFNTDCGKIANNTGKTKAEIQKVKEYLFNNDSFEPDCAIAQSWQRLMNGKDIKEHDRVLIEHELYEMKLKKENKNMSHTEAHAIATKKFDYQKGVDEYYGNLKQAKKKK